MNADREPLPIHLAFYWLGAARRTPEGVLMGGEFGPYVECLAGLVDRITVVAHDPPDRVSSSEDRADYVARPERNNIDVLSLGPKGTWREYLQRRRLIAATIGPASETWDVLVLRFGRRAHLVFDPSRCPRTVTLVHGPAGSGLGAETATLAERVRGWVLGMRARWHLRRILRRSRVLVTDGEECRAIYGRHVDRTSVIRLSVRRSDQMHVAQDRLVGDAPRFLFVGQVGRKKGIAETIAGFAEIRRILPNARLDVVGSGPDLDAAMALVAERGIADAVTFHGWVSPGEELFAFYRRADVLLFLSRSTTESFPRVVGEALAHSVLVIGTPVGSLPLVFADNREMLFVAPTTAEVVAAVQKLLDDAELRRMLIERGREWADETSLEFISRALVDTVTTCWPELSTART